VSQNAASDAFEPDFLVPVQGGDSFWTADELAAMTFMDMAFMSMASPGAERPFHGYESKHGFISSGPGRFP